LAVRFAWTSCPRTLNESEKRQISAIAAFMD
jgi:hypothetical protein